MKKYIIPIITIFLAATILLSLTLNVQAATGMEELDNPDAFIQQQR